MTAPQSACARFYSCDFGFNLSRVHWYERSQLGVSESQVMDRTTDSTGNIHDAVLSQPLVRIPASGDMLGPLRPDSTEVAVARGGVGYVQIITLIVHHKGRYFPEIEELAGDAHRYDETYNIVIAQFSPSAASCAENAYLDGV